MSFYVSTATFVLLHCDEWDRVVALPRHKFVTGATLLQLGATILGRNCSMTQIMAVTGHKSASSVAVYQRVSSKEKQVMGDIITSSVRGEQPSQLSSIMPPHSTSRLQLMPPTQNSSSSTSLVQMRANTHVSSSVTDVVDILDVNYDDLFCDYNTLTTVNSVTNTRTIQQTPMFHGCTITNLNITINK